MILYILCNKLNGFYDCISVALGVGGRFPRGQAITCWPAVPPRATSSPIANAGPKTGLAFEWHDDWAATGLPITPTLSVVQTNNWCQVSYNGQS